MKSHVLILICGFAAIALLHVVIGVSLYSGRIAHASSLSDSDFVVFFLPMFAAFVGYVVLGYKSTSEVNNHGLRLGLAVSLAIVSLLISSACTMVVAFNTFGS